MRIAHAAAAAFACAALAGGAQELEPGAGPPLLLRLDRSIELRVGAQRVTQGYGDWSEAAVFGTYRAGAHLLQAELASQRRFHDHGTYFALTDTYTLDADWYASLAAGAGDGAFFLPRYRVDAFIHRKLLADRSLVASLGWGHYRAPDGHIDRSVTLGAAYYSAPWVLQAAARRNESDPGSVEAWQYVVAATYGRQGRDLVIGRYGWGRESYLAIGPATSIVDFASREASLQWRHWLGPTQGFALALEHYRNPLYERSGASIAWFVQLR